MKELSILTPRYRADLWRLIWAYLDKKTEGRVLVMSREVRLRVNPGFDLLIRVRVREAQEVGPWTITGLSVVTRE